MIYHFFDVCKTHPEDQIMALDLVGIYVADEAICEKLPYTESHLAEDIYKQYYAPGSVVPLLSGSPRIVKGNYVFGNHKALLMEYIQGIKIYPLLLLKIKWAAFRKLLETGIPFWWYQSEVYPNEFGIKLNKRFQNVRSYLWSMSEIVIKNKYWRWFSGVHLVWLIINFILILGTIAACVLKKELRFLLFLWILLIPFVYYCSYFLSPTGYDFRYMYPATLMVQVITITSICGLISASLDKI